MGGDSTGWWDTYDTLTLVIKHGWPANPILNGNIMCRESVQIFVVDFPWSCLSKKHIHTGWCPPVISWFINPMNTIVLSVINHRFNGSYLHQLNAIPNWGTTARRVSGFCFPMDQENRIWLKEETFSIRLYFETAMTWVTPLCVFTNPKH